MASSIALSRVHFPVTTLGPGRRLGIWFQGCTIRCPGCISADTWSRGNALLPVTDLLSAVVEYASEADGVTISGGEPFEQPDALGELLGLLRTVLPPDGDVLIYSGLPFKSLEPWLSRWPGLIDAVISEPFDILAPQTRPLMGSDNQVLHALTDRGLRRYAAFQRLRNSQDNRLDVMFDQDGTAWMAGIPRRGDLERLQSLLASRGVTVRTTEHAAR